MTIGRFRSTESKSGLIIIIADLDDLHLLLVVHVVDGETALVDEEVQTGIKVHQQLFCQRPQRTGSR